MSEDTEGRNPKPNDLPRATLWHFTDQNGLHPILLGNDGLLAAHVSFMSDTDDDSLGKRLNKLIMHLFSVMAEKSKPGTTVPDDVRRKFDETANSGSLFPVFVACFTTSPDEERQWTERTGNGGFAIGFSKELQDELTASYPSFDEGNQLPVNRGGVFQSCDYEHYDQQQRELKQIENEVSEVERIIVRSEKSLTAEFSKRFANLLQHLREESQRMTFFKKPSLAWEREYRLAYYFPDKDVPLGRFRFIAGKPRVTMELKKPLGNYVREILISPFGDVAKSTVIAHLVGAAIGLNPDCINSMRLEIHRENETKIKTDEGAGK